MELWLDVSGLCRLGRESPVFSQCLRQMLFNGEILETAARRLPQGETMIVCCVLQWLPETSSAQVDSLTLEQVTASISTVSSMEHIYRYCRL